MTALTQTSWNKYKITLNGKVRGLDGILNETIKAAKSRIVSSLTKFVNQILKLCLFPKTWRVGIIITLFNGDVRSIPGNYRGIFLSAT